MLRLRPFLIAVSLNAFAWLAFLLVLLAFYFLWLRDYQMNWGATAEEVNRPMAGDEMLQDPELNATRAVEIDAPPEDIWPWVVQIGYGKGGFYGFDKLDNGGRPSADSIIPEFQDLQAGDSIPGGEYKGQLVNLLEVVEMDPEKSMLWVFVKGLPWQDATWSWGLYKIDNRRTRLVSRLRHKYTYNTMQEKITWPLIDATEILMMRTTLLGIKRRAEGR